MSPAYWIYFVMAATALFNGLKGLSRFRLWRIDTAREKLEAEVRQIAGDVVSSAPIPDLSTRNLMIDQERRAAAQDILDRLAKLRSRSQHHARALHRRRRWKRPVAVDDRGNPAMEVHRQRSLL